MIYLIWRQRQKWTPGPPPPHTPTHCSSSLGCSEIFSTRHKKPQRLQNCSVLKHKGKKIYWSWMKGFGGKKSLIYLLEKLQIWKITNLYCLSSEKYCRAAHSWSQFTAEVTEGKSSSGESASGASSLRFVLWPSCVFMVHQFFGGFTSNIEHKKCVFLHKIRRKFTSLALFFQPFAPCLTSERGAWLKLCYVILKKKDQN